MIDQIRALSLPAQDNISFGDAIDIYQAYRPLMPAAVAASPTTQTRLIDIVPQVDALVLDGYGVINVGSGPIDGIHDLFDAAAKHDVPIIVLTNGASFDTAKTHAKYQGWGLPISHEQIVSSRDAMVAAVAPALLSAPDLGPALDPKADQTDNLALANIGSFSATSLPIGVPGERRLETGTDFYDATQNFVFLGSVDWTETDQQNLEAAFLADNLPGGRQLHIANPDVVSPHENSLNAEPGYWTARLIQRTGVMPQWYGKPYAPAFQQALDRLQHLYGRNIDPSRIAMVGDSLHTDIIGGGAMGMQTVLLTDYGLFREGGFARAIESCGIFPNWIASKL